MAAVALVVALCVVSVLGARTNAISRIVFASDRTGAWALYTMAIDGTDVRPLWSAVPGGKEPAFSPTGRLIAFESDNGESSNDTLWVADPDGTDAHQLVDWRGTDFYPAWSPDGAKLLADRNGGIVEMNANGSGQHTLVAHGRDPAWSPDGRAIVYAQASSLWEVHPDGSGAHRLHVFGGGEYPRAAWSPDSKQLVVSASGAGSNSDLYLYTATGTLVRRLTDTANQSEDAPSWAPAHNIAFSGKAGTYRISPSGGAAHLMISGGYEASWGPGGRLVYDTQDPSGSHLFITGGGLGVHEVAAGADNAAMPVWSPNGSEVAFVDNLKLATIEANGTGLTVTTVPAPDGVAWAPNGTELAVSDGQTLSVVRPGGSTVWSLRLPPMNTGDPHPDLGQPAWAPGGSTILVPGTGTAEEEIYAVPAAGGSSSVLVPDSPTLQSPGDVSFSPDGAHIAYTVLSTGAGDRTVVRVAGADGTGAATIYTLPPGEDVVGATTWSPDGGTIILSESTGGSTEQIESLPAAGGSATALTSPPGSNREPDA